ncbi:Glutaredoxin domain protein [Cladophialophora carrionii]|uniref:Glutaredoxin domain protein n=1 Tax=Cladophialophora carrionii TaxID=86049 RepID=A0A1C1CTK2_9EURO|nr:Glutaredoxin domain protein [Cladophialophora carrionii]
MAGMRRGQALFLALGIVLIYFLFFSGSGSSTDFRKTTEASLSRRRGVLRGALSDKELTAQTNRELQKILDRQSELRDQDRDQKIFDASPVQGAHPYTSTISFDDGVPIGGRKTMPKDKPRYPVDTVKAAGVTSPVADGQGEEVAYNGNKVEKAQDEGEDRAREELQSILRKSPIIIFSKSYCPYSKRAKALLLQTYSITPAPYVVELDLMTDPVPRPHDADDDDDDAPAPTLGKKLQDLLAVLTGRRTVPNIMISAQSLGGSDDLARLDAEGTLEEHIKKMGGKRIVSIEKKHKDED